jgi:1-acyl-sn-glycerol-3-phosphate acyltransferase
MPEDTAPIHQRTKKRTRYNAFFRWLGRTALRLLGWKVVGCRPDAPKCIVACAPHTSYWDFPYTLFASYALNIPAVFMMKKEMFRGPLGILLRWLGAIPVDRHAPSGVVDQMVQVIRESERIAVVITPEGTRDEVTYWKLGFWRMAVAADVPILFGIMNYKEKWIGVADTYHPTGDLDEDWRHITEVFERTVQVTPVHRVQDQEKRET